MTRVKICGINSPAAFDATVQAAADWIGFVFFPPSPRHVTPAQAAILSARYAGGPKRVGLFVDPTDTMLETTLMTVALDVLQLHTSSARAAEIHSRFGLPVWRAVGVARSADLPIGADGADAILLDAQAPTGANRPGGNATLFDWSILRDFRPAYRWLLAGGLTPENVSDAIRATCAPAVDVSSGVESSKGVKDPEKIHAFIANVRATQR